MTVGCLLLVAGTLWFVSVTEQESFFDHTYLSALHMV
jgi:hypothetical protein